VNRLRKSRHAEDSRVVPIGGLQVRFSAASDRQHCIERFESRSADTSKSCSSGTYAQASSLASMGQPDSTALLRIRCLLGWKTVAFWFRGTMLIHDTLRGGAFEPVHIVAMGKVFQAIACLIRCVLPIAMMAGQTRPALSLTGSKAHLRAGGSSASRVEQCEPHVAMRPHVHLAS
jgi:hypothetical protein